MKSLLALAALTLANTAERPNILWITCDDTRNGYVFLHALNALQYAHVDDRLTKADWISFRNKKSQKNHDPNGAQISLRIIEDAITLFPI